MPMMLSFHRFRYIEQQGIHHDPQPFPAISPTEPNANIANLSLELLLWAKLVGVSALLLSAVGGTGWETGVALAADHLVTVVFGGEGLERWLDQTTTKTKDQVESRFLLDIVVGQGAAVFKLLSGEDQSLLIRWNSLLVLDLRLDIVDGIGRLHLEGDSFSREGLDEAV